MKEKQINQTFENNNDRYKILNLKGTNLNESETIPTKNIQEKKIIIERKSEQKIQIYKAPINPENQNFKNLYKNNLKYKLLIKKIAKNLCKRKYFPKCKIFKFYLSYRILILRIAKRIKRTAKKLNFWEKWENNITEQEINQIQEIASTACKIIQEKGKKKFSSSDRKNKKNMKVGLSLFKKNENTLINNGNDDKSEIQQKINILKNMNTKDNKFISNFSNFLKSNNVEILSDSKLPNITNKRNIYLLSQKEFWIKYIIFISIKYKKDLTIYNYANIIEQYYIWNINNIYDEFITEIINRIKDTFDRDTINKFLMINKTKELNDLFVRYKNIHINNNYKFIKINKNDCQCSTCINNGFINKIVNYNKMHNIISYSKDNNLSFIKKNVSNKKKLDKNNNNKNCNYNEVSKKFDDVDVFEYLNKIEKRKIDNYGIKNEKKNRNSNSSKKKKNNNKKNITDKDKNYKIQEIYDLLSIDVDLENLDNNDKNEDKESSTNKLSKNDKNNIKKKKHYP